MHKQATEKGAFVEQQVAADVEKLQKFLRYLQDSSARGDRADDVQLEKLGMARTPYRVLYHEGSARVLEYSPPPGVSEWPVPVLMLYSFINRWYILDLMPDHSFIEYLTNVGFRVYVVDWGIPGAEHSNLGLDFYLEKLALRAVRRVRRLHGGSPVTLFGYCLGGTLAGMLAALHPEEFANMVLWTTPFEFEEAGILSIWTNKDFFDSERMAKAFGCIPEKILHAPFPFMKPRDHFAKPRLLFENILNDAYLKNFRSLDRWVTDNVPFPGRVFQEIVTGCYQENRLAKGEMLVGSRKVNLKAANMPVLNVFAKNDHIVPPATAKRNSKLLGGKTTDKEYDAAHLTITVAHPIRKTDWAETEHWLRSSANLKV